ncbi:MAG: YdeI/OmpD-associated family protein [Candidatus Levyibacteriota bacterium]
MEMHKDVPVYLFTTAEQWAEWLEKNHERVSAVWLKFAKKNTGAVSISYDEALDEALCYGWIDGLINSYDEKYYLTRFTPRGAKSIWSKRNREHIARLLKEKKMKPAGLLTVETAKKSGQWEAAYDSSREMTIPEDFLTELAKDEKALAFYHTLNKANLYAIGWRLQTAKKPQTRAKRFESLLTMLKKGEKLH